MKLPALRPLGAVLTLLLTVSWPLASASAGIVRDVPYAQAGESSLLLDVHQPEGEGPFPVIILVHGGGWGSGDKAGSDKPGNGADITPWFGLSDRFVLFSINYRLSPPNRWPACLDDTLAAIRWVKAHAAEYQGDPARVALMGHSAGGHLVALAATEGGPAEEVQAVVGCAPVTSFEQDLERRKFENAGIQHLFGRSSPKVDAEMLALMRGIQPLNRVKAGLPPFLLVHGTDDKTVPLQQSVDFRERLEAFGVPVELLPIHGAGHGLLKWDLGDPAWLDKIGDWLDRTMEISKPARVHTDANGREHSYHAFVAADGSGDYTSVQEAINAAPQKTSGVDPWIILIKPGTYKERLYVQREKRHVVLRGLDAESTIVTYHLGARDLGPDGKPMGTFATPSVFIDADDFTVENLTIANEFGVGSQALALRVDGDRAVFRNCRFLAHQDTILVNKGRHYFADCYIEGTVDYIFGGATAYFDRCHLHCISDGYITAASTPQDQPYGYVFRGCKVTANEGVKFYLGRPWRDYAAVDFIDTWLPAETRPVGWHNWGKPERELTTRYREHGSTGPGANPAERVTWARPLTAPEAAHLTPAVVLAGDDDWNPDHVAR